MAKRLAHILLLAMTIAFFTACSPETNGGGEPYSPTVDTQAPVIKVHHSNVDITGVEEIIIKGNELQIGNLLVASWSDNVTKSCSVSMKINGNEVASGSVPVVSGTLTLTVTDNAGNSSSATIKLKMQESHPDITIYKPEVNVFGGVTLGIHDGYLSINDEEVMAWSDKYTTSCTVTVSQGNKEFHDGDILSEAGTLKVTVTNRQGKSTAAEITLVCKAISGMETLTLQVDHETDLLEGITFASGATLIKTEIEMDGKRTVIDDPTHFTPEYPGICTLIFTVRGADGTTIEGKVENVTIKPLNYTEPSIATADMIGTTYPWYNNLRQSTRNFIYPHLQASYAACNHSKLANRVHIIMTETYEGADNIGNMNAPTDHAYEGYWRIKSLCPGTSIKCVYSPERFEEYCNVHPIDCYFVSRAVDNLSCSNWEELSSTDKTKTLKRLLEKENFILCSAISNRTTTRWKNYNELVMDGDLYNTASVNSLMNNKITVAGYHTNGYNNFFVPDTDSGKGTESKMPIGFESTKGNIVMPMPAVIGGNNKENTTTASSYPTAVASAVVGNAVAVVMANHEGITPVGAMDIIVAKYLREETFQYMDETTNWQLTDGGKWYFLKMEELLNNELLQAGRLESLSLNGDDVELPQCKGICYTGKGIQFEVDGTRHDLTDAAALKQVLKAGNARWFWNRSLFRKQGGTTSTELNVHVSDINGNLIPDLHHTVTKPIN